jgi:anti-anti-sigma regulatory factor
MPTLSILSVGRTRRGYSVRVVGRGTMRESPAVQAFALQVLDEPGRPALDIDLTDCEYLDSTFLGSLLGLYRRFAQAGTAERFAVAGPAEVLHRLLGPIRLDAILPLRAERPERLGEELCIPPQVLDSEACSRHILESHRRLAELGGANEAVFGPIADQMARELDHRAGSRPA